MSFIDELNAQICIIPTLLMSLKMVSLFYLYKALIACLQHNNVTNFIDHMANLQAVKFLREWHQGSNNKL